jgi:putative mRNA 3-end processing factor
MSVSLTYLGGASEVGRAGAVLEGPEGRLLLDYGIQPDDPPKFPLPAPDVDALLLTHAHLDHCGLAPKVASRGTPVISTPVTGALAGRMAQDTLRVAELEGYPLPFLPASIGDLAHSLRPSKPGSVEYRGGFEFQMFNAGHIPGAVMFDFPQQDFLFTGDFHAVDTQLTRAAKPRPCKTLAIESTYGGRDHPNRHQTESELVDSIEDVVNSGGRVVLPSFGLGRSQELLMLVRNLGFEVWLDGMGRDIARILQKYPGSIRDVSSMHKAIRQTNFVKHSRHREVALNADVIVTTSGMLNGGPVLHYLSRLRKDSSSAVFLTGFQVPGTNGHLLKETGKLRLDRNPESPSFELECQLKAFDLSGHAGHSQIVDFVNACSPEKVILYHGDNREAFIDDLKDYDLLLPRENETIDIA